MITGLGLWFFQCTGRRNSLGKDDNGNVVGVADYKKLMDEIPNKIRNAMRHYIFTDEELDFIINYDIKYRRGESWRGRSMITLNKI